MPYEPERPHGWVLKPVPMSRAHPERPTEQTCHLCQRTLPFTEEFFYKRRPVGTALRRVCRDCEKRRSRDYKRRQRADGTLAPTDRAYASMWAKTKRRNENRAQGYTYAPRHWWTSYRAATEIGVCVEQVRAWIRQGRLPAQRSGRHEWRLDPQVVEAFAVNRAAFGHQYKAPRTTKLARKKNPPRRNHDAEAAD